MVHVRGTHIFQIGDVLEIESRINDRHLYASMVVVVVMMMIVMPTLSLISVTNKKSYVDGFVGMFRVRRSRFDEHDFVRAQLHARIVETQRTWCETCKGARVPRRLVVAGRDG